MACRGAIKAGEVLKEEAIQALLAQLDEAPVSSHCPHGRPLWRLIPYGDIHQSFRRLNRRGKRGKRGKRKKANTSGFFNLFPFSPFHLLPQVIENRI